MKISKIYEKGIREQNEDAYTINDTAAIYAVMDGATGLTGVPGDIASQTVKKVLDKATVDQNIWELVKQANQQLQSGITNYLQMQMGENVSFTDITKLQRSTTGVAAIQFDSKHHYMDYIHAADCMIFLQYENDDIRAITYDVVQYLDGLAIDIVVGEQRSGSRNGVAIEELVKEIKPLLIENRKKANTMNGYGVIDGSKEAMKHVEYGRISLKRVKKILLLTDGLQMPVEAEDDGAWENAAATAFKTGIMGLWQTVDKMENQDPNCEKYPRLKMQDDKTGILIEL